MGLMDNAIKETVKDKKKFDLCINGFTNKIDILNCIKDNIENNNESDRLTALDDLNQLIEYEEQYEI